MTTAKLYAAFFSPRYGNFTHWALYLDDEDIPMVFEVTGQHPDFQRNVIQAKAEEDPTFLGKEYIGLVNQADIEEIKDAATAVHVDNETVEWDCQDYVLEILDKLVDDFILDEDDEDYREARMILREKRGPNL
jgi:hypothetical protein